MNFSEFMNLTFLKNKINRKYKNIDAYDIYQYIDELLPLLVKLWKTCSLCFSRLRNSKLGFYFKKSEQKNDKHLKIYNSFNRFSIASKKAMPRSIRY